MAPLRGAFSWQGLWQSLCSSGFVVTVSELKGGFVNSFVPNGINMGKNKMQIKAARKAVLICGRGNKYLRG